MFLLRFGKATLPINMRILPNSVLSIATIRV
nr:MAG TPA: hypothetical protein [Caudoviricetes sp.]DAS13843.1 MAG TPA: hypothetical protein [Caudoviricetes sp.]